jgi:hypothetical protein
MQPPSPYRLLAHSLDPVVFAREALGFVADPWQETLLRTTAAQVILNCSRQSGASGLARPTNFDVDAVRSKGFLL